MKKQASAQITIMPKKAQLLRFRSKVILSKIVAVAKENLRSRTNFIITHLMRTVAKQPDLAFVGCPIDFSAIMTFPVRQRSCNNSRRFEMIRYLSHQLNRLIICYLETIISYPTLVTKYLPYSTI